MNNIRKTWTAYDVMYGLVATPLLIVAAMTFAGAVSWQTQSKQADRAWQAIQADLGGNDSRALAKWYDGNKSKAQTLKFKRVLAASEAILAQFDDCSPDFDPTEIVRVTPPDQPLPLAHFVRSLAEIAKPVLQLLESIEKADANIWYPIILDGTDPYLPDALQSRSLTRLLKIEFLDAFHQGDNQRAIVALNLLDRFYGADHRSMCITEELACLDANSIARELVLQSLLHDIWTKDDLAHIQELVSRDVDWQRRWQDVTRGEMLLDPPWQEKEIREYGYFRKLTRRAWIAPSEKHEIAEHHAVIASTDAVATPHHSKIISDIVSPRTEKMESSWAPDRWLQIPRINANTSAYLSFDSYAGMADRFAYAANEQHLTRCAVAIKQFATHNNRLPESLDALSSVGLPPDAIENQDGQMFRYQVAEDGATANLRSRAGPLVTMIAK